MLRTFSRRFKSTSHSAKAQAVTKNGFGEQSMAQTDGSMSIDEFYSQMMEKAKKWGSFADQDVVNPGETPEHIKSLCDLTIPKKGEGLEGVLKGIDQYITHSTRTHHPKFMNKFGLGLNQAAFSGEVFAGLTQ